MCYSELRQEDLATIVEAILLVSKTKKEDYPYHEIVNLSSIRSVMTKLGQLGKNSLDWRETVRYFFVADKQLLEYQLEQVKDELRRLTSAKLNSDVHDKELFIFSEQSGAPVLDLYDVLSSPSKLIFGPEKDIIQVYQQLQRQLL